MPLLTIVLPCYNPLPKWHVNVAANIKGLQQMLPTEVSIELIIVNDGSTNNNFTEEAILYIKQHVANGCVLNFTKNRGKGAALRSGIAESKGDYIIYTDIDFPYTHESFFQIFNALNSSDIAIGTRGESYYANVPFIRVMISKLLKWFIKLAFNIPTNDTQGGLKGMKKDVAKVFLTTKINRYLFDLEFIYLASKSGLKFALVPVVLRPNLTMSKMNWKVLLGESRNLLKLFLKW
jgi:glycosyltransferase involved in cell wall biosynthesis